MVLVLTPCTCRFLISGPDIISLPKYVPSFPRSQTLETAERTVKYRRDVIKREPMDVACAFGYAAASTASNALPYKDVKV